MTDEVGGGDDRVIVIGAVGGAVGTEGQFRVHDDGLGYSGAVEEANRVFQMLARPYRIKRAAQSELRWCVALWSLVSVAGSSPDGGVSIPTAMSTVGLDFR